MSTARFKGCKRGVFGLTSWNFPLRRPQALTETSIAGVSWREGQKLLVKYKYQANPESPLGEPELNIQQKENVWFVCSHPSNQHWVRVKSEGHVEGYVPASYLLAVEEELTSLPWLNKAQANMQQEAAEWKPYKSAYAPKEKAAPGGASAAESYFCDICAKQLNGPIPYQAHLSSKAHKEEVEAQMDN